MDLKETAEQIKKNSESFAGVISACKTLLWHSSKAEECLFYIKSRINEEYVKKYDIGYWPPNEDLSLLLEYIPEKTLSQLGLIATYHNMNRGHIDVVKHGFFHFNNLIFPFCDYYGNIITLSGRTLLTESEKNGLKIPKYKNAPFKRQCHLFGIHLAYQEILKKNKAVIVEGQIDCIKCQSKGITNAVSLNGSELTLNQAMLLRRFTNNLYLLLDNDEAGEKAVEKIKNKYSSFFNISVGQIPKEFNDVDEFLTKSDRWNDFLRDI